MIRRIDQTGSIATGNAYIVPSTNIEDTLNIIHDTHDTFKLHLAVNKVYSFFTPMNVRCRLGAQSIFRKTNRINIYHLVKQSSKGIIKYMGNSISTLSRKNVFLDSSDFLTLVIHRLKRVSQECVPLFLNSYLDYIKSSTPDYNHHYIIVNLSKETNPYMTFNSIRSTDFRHINSFYGFLLYGFRYMPEETRQILGNNTTVLFVSDKGIAKFDNTTFEHDLEKYLNKDKWLYTLFTSLRRIHGIHEDGEEHTDDKLAEDDGIADNKSLDINRNKAMTEILDATPDDTVDVDISKRALMDQYVDAVSIESDDKKKEIADHMISSIRTNISDRMGIKKQPVILKKIAGTEAVSVTDYMGKVIDTISTGNIPVRHYDATTVDDLHTNSFFELNKKYDEEVKHTHIKKIAQHFSKLEVPLYIDKIKVDNVSDSFNHMDEYKMSFKDKDGNRSTANVLVPKMLRDRFFLIGGNKKMLLNQLISLPIVKNGEDVIITTNYNKVFMSYKGDKYLTNSESALLKGISAVDKKAIADKITFGDYYETNMDSGITTTSYNRISKYIISIHTPKVQLSFRYDDCIKKYGDKTKENILTIGTYNGSNIDLMLDSDVVNGTDDITGLSLSEAIYLMSKDDIPSLYKTLNVLNEDQDLNDLIGIDDMIVFLSKHEIDELHNEITKIKTIPKTLASTHIKIMGRYIPLIYVLMYTDGLFTILDKHHIDYEMLYKINVKLDDDTKKPKFDKHKQMIIETRDAWVTFNINTIENSTLLHPLLKLDLTPYKTSDLEKKDLMAVIIENYADSINLHLYLDSFHDLLIDPITKEILEDFNLPTEFSDVMIYSNWLLAHGQNQDDIDIKNQRLRKNEIITATLYGVMAEKYNEYAIKKKRGNKNEKFTMDKYALIKALHELNTMESYDTLNPIKELNRATAASRKGYKGVNMEHAYTIDKRSHHQSFYGNIALSSVYNSEVGVLKEMVLDPKVISTRGYMETCKNKEDIDKLTTKQLLGVSEMAVPFIINHDDAQRTAMALSQNNHIMPVHSSDPLLVTYGFDEMIPHLTADFTFKAAKDGQVISIDDHYIGIRYSDGTTQAHPLEITEKNAGKSFYTSNIMDLCKGVKVGYKFKKNDILAYNNSFFTEQNGKVIFTPGPMANVFIHSAPELYEDSTMIGESFASKTAADVTKKYHVNLDHNAIVRSFRMLGEDVNASDPLITYTTPTEDDFLNTLLAGEDVSDINIMEEKTKKTGIINEVRVYYACEYDTLSDSIRKMIGDVNTEINREETILRSHGDNTDKIMRTTKPVKVQPGFKINGSIVNENEVLIEYYVRSLDISSIGDKCAYYASVKGIIGKVVKDKDMPYAEYSKVRADCMLRAPSIGARKVYSIHIAGACNKALIKLGKEMQEFASKY